MPCNGNACVPREGSTGPGGSDQTGAQKSLYAKTMYLDFWTPPDATHAGRGSLHRFSIACTMSIYLLIVQSFSSWSVLYSSAVPSPPILPIFDILTGPPRRAILPVTIFCVALATSRLSSSQLPQRHCQDFWRMRRKLKANPH